MSHRQTSYRTAFAVICMVSMLFLSVLQPDAVQASLAGYEFVVLNTFSKTLNIGDEFYLSAVTSTGKKPAFSSSDKSVASVNTYGKVTAKKAGTAIITAKIKNGEASCKIKVNKTAIRLSAKQISLEIGYSAKLKASVSTGHPVKFKSAKSSVASVSETGVISAKKAGTTTITATADKTSASCKVTVKTPKLKINRTSVSLYRKGTVKLSVTSTSKHAPKWKSNKKSVATVDETGMVTAVKNGTAVITATVDGASKTCEVTVKKPEVSFETESVTLSVGQKYETKAKVSSKNRPEYSSSNTSVASVDEHGVITAASEGKAYIYAKEDGVKARLTVIVKTN